VRKARATVQNHNERASRAHRLVVELWVAAKNPPRLSRNRRGAQSDKRGNSDQHNQNEMMANHEQLAGRVDHIKSLHKKLRGVPDAEHKRRQEQLKSPKRRYTRGVLPHFSTQSVASATRNPATASPCHSTGRAPKILGPATPTFDGGRTREPTAFHPGSISAMESDPEPALLRSRIIPLWNDPDPDETILDGTLHVS